MKVKHLLQCHLLVPGMLPELVASGLRLPGLEGLLMFADRSEAFEGCAESWLCRAFAVQKQNDWPVAPYSLLGEGGEPGDAYWLRADPVYLHLLRDSLSMADCKPFDLTMDEATSLLDTLNRHFAADGLQFVAHDPNRWYVRLPRPPVLTTKPLSEVVGQDVDVVLPQSSDAMQWHGCINEAQMLLHDHPVNLEREQHRQLPVNSIWPWGGGALQHIDRSFYTGLAADDKLALGLAQAAKVDAVPTPISLSDWLQGQPSGAYLIVLNRLDQPELRRHPEAWAKSVQELDKLWFLPLLEKLKTGAVQRVELHMADFARVRSFVVERTNLWKFWRRPKPLETYLHG